MTGWNWREAACGNRDIPPSCTSCYLVLLVGFGFQPKNERVNMPLPPPLLDAVKAMAAKAGVPYQRFLRHTLETLCTRARVHDASHTKGHGLMSKTGRRPQIICSGSPGRA